MAVTHFFRFSKSGDRLVQLDGHVIGLLLKGDEGEINQTHERVCLQLQVIRAMDPLSVPRALEDRSHLLLFG